MATMLSGADLAERYVAEYPCTSFSRNCIKCMLRSGCIPSVKAGCRVFYSWERWLEFLDHGNELLAEPLEDYGKIRRII